MIQLIASLLLAAPAAAQSSQAQLERMFRALPYEAVEISVTLHGTAKVASTAGGQTNAFDARTTVRWYRWKPEMIRAWEELAAAASGAIPPLPPGERVQITGDYPRIMMEGSLRQREGKYVIVLDRPELQQLTPEYVYSGELEWDAEKGVISGTVRTDYANHHIKEEIVFTAEERLTGEYGVCGALIQRSGDYFIAGDFGSYQLPKTNLADPTVRLEFGRTGLEKGLEVMSPKSHGGPTMYDQQYCFRGKLAPRTGPGSHRFESGSGGSGVLHVSGVRKLPKTELP